MLAIYRRHVRGCKYASDRISKQCRCPLWLTGTLVGKPYRRSAKTRSFERAEKIKRDIEDGKKPTATVPKIEDAIKKFMLDAEHGRKLSKATLKKYRVVTDQLKAFALKTGVSKLDDVTTDFTREFRASWNDGGISSQKKLERLRAFFRFCTLSNWIPSNPAVGISAPVIKTPPTLPFTDKEMAAILKHADDARWHALVQVLRWSGLRIGDAMKLTADKLDGNRLFLRTAKTGVNVFVPLPDFVLTEIEQLPKYGGYFFWKREGESNIDTAAGNARRSLRKIFKAAGIKRGHPHRFRDTFSVALLHKGVSIETVATLLGNSARVCAKHYAPWVQSLQDNLERAVAKTWDKPKLQLIKP